MDSLQFQKAEFADSRPKCLFCKNPVEGTYFHVAGQVTCPNCASQVQAGSLRPTSGGVIRGLLFGTGAAIVSSLVYGLVLLAGVELALLSIGAGYVIGRAVRIGAGGRGGLRCQMAAVVLTYLAIALAYLVPVLGKVNPLYTSIGLIVGYIPLQIGEGGGGLLSLAILAFGLFQAWKQTKRHNLAVTGPFTLGEASNPLAQNG